MCSNEDSVCAFLSWKTCTAFTLQRDKCICVRELQCCHKIKTSWSKHIIFFFELKCWLKYVAHKHILCSNVWSSQRMVATFGIPKKPQTGHIRQMAVVHAQINLHVYSSTDNTHHIHTKTLWARWKQLKQQLCLLKIDVTDLLFFLELLKNFGRYHMFLL